MEFAKKFKPIICIYIHAATEKFIHDGVSHIFRLPPENCRRMNCNGKFFGRYKPDCERFVDAVRFIKENGVKL